MGKEMAERSVYSLNTQEAIKHILAIKSKEETREYVIAMLCLIKCAEDNVTFEEIKQDIKLGSFLKESLDLDIDSYPFNDNFIFTGMCKCGMRISKSINDPHSTRSDKARYFYTSQAQNQGYNIFRCKQCKKVADTCWKRDQQIPTRAKG